MEVDTIDDQCLYCNGPVRPSTNNSFSCETCKRKVHLSCLETPLPSTLLGDLFFNYVCKFCSVLRREELHRQKMSWLHVVTLALYNLKENSYDISRSGFFHWKIHISNLIEEHWISIFGNSKKRKTWIGTVSGTLSQYSPQYFLSGKNILNEAGWWKLAHPYSPAEIAQDGTKIGLLGVSAHSSKLFAQDVDRYTREGYNDDIADSPTAGHNSSPSLTPVWQMCAADDQESDSQSGSSSSVHQLQSSQRNAMYSRAYVQPSATLSHCLFADDEENDDEESLLDIDVDNNEVVKTEGGSSLSRSMVQRSALLLREAYNNLDGDMKEVADIFLQPQSAARSSSLTPPPPLLLPEVEEETLPQPEKSLFTRRTKKSITDQLERNVIKRISEIGGVPMSEYTEVKLLNSMRRALAAPHEDVPSSVYRLFRKLMVRKIKRERGLPLFNFDRYLDGRGASAGTSWQQVNAFISSSNMPRTERILDRFKEASHLTSKFSGTPGYLSNLISWCEPVCLKSPFTHRMLKPYIRRDRTSNPLWVQLMVELTETVKKKGIGVPPLPSYYVAPIDYCYINAWHIQAINALAREYFWPGIDLSDCLQYPDFSCVVLYRKLIVGFAVMVPDVQHNETYISFLFTRPEWRRAGIATFMLYHLIQTCMGKDITLHVSATNPAVILYQKFGFKVEEFIQDFYEMYLPINSRECKHALFLRLSR
ncbi:cysteine-rich protein 2-binding protein [Ischnura elegans]|uniref:cysteine-rich protein 2-binding protein n=1 Tax=Ischnura elegans TaxID=197161 RepID=UPI001ED88A04|nr:cysteine-rich protein 2-binding protein [Ischnura elegans]